MFSSGFPRTRMRSASRPGCTTPALTPSACAASCVDAMIVSIGVRPANRTSASASRHTELAVEKAGRPRIGSHDDTTASVDELASRSRSDPHLKLDLAEVTERRESAERSDDRIGKPPELTAEAGILNPFRPRKMRGIERHPVCDRLRHGNLPIRDQPQRLVLEQWILMPRSRVVEEVDPALDRDADLLVGIHVRADALPSSVRFIRNRFHLLEREAGIGLDEVGASVEQSKRQRASPLRECARSS